MKVLLVLVAAVLAAVPGCAEPDDRVADMAQQVTHEQAEQNQLIAEGSRAVAQGSQLLVEHDAKAHRELVQLQQDLRQDQTDISKQRDSLEVERKAIAGQRGRESQLGALCVGLAMLLVCLAPLVLAGMSLLGLWSAPTQEEERGVLVEEMSLWLEQEMPHVPTFPAPPDRTIGLSEDGPASQP